MDLQRPKLSDDNRNRFSDLSESVILHSFSFMDTIDVVRASAVATNWRYLWTKMPRLSFDYKRFYGTRGWDDMEFKDLINWVLMAHDKSVSIQSFRLSCFGDHWIYKWMNIVAQKHVRQLHLEEIWNRNLRERLSKRILKFRDTRSQIPSTHSPSASLLRLQNSNNSNNDSPLRRSPLFRTAMTAPAPPFSFISNGNARRLLLDPAIHEEFTRLKNLVEEKDKKVKELQENIAAVSFTPQSKIGKMLMAKCRTLQEENEEIGTQAEEGKIHELAMKLALQKSQNAELRSQFEALYNQMEGLTNDAERSNETVYILQEKLEERENEIKRLKLELQQKTQVKEDEMATDVDVATDTSKVKDEMVTDETGNSEQTE
ncbi:hypothetical protein COLO4_30111 [Corchorus olitorius]|uniref:F-box domain-containing protein n=1 Tax=Corchorus olitorius TaxID=93759 RepID=A0A1R3HBA9_9ROSI|nr:hypothetical protein COLO4_30111 [Corchorus olitorius]